MKDEAEQNSLNDLIASGGLPEATPLGEKSREQLIEDKDFLFQTNKNFQAEIISITAECNDLHDEIEKSCKELGDAGILITQGPRDGITKLINERDELRAKLVKECDDWKKAYTAMCAEYDAEISTLKKKLNDG